MVVIIGIALQDTISCENFTFREGKMVEIVGSFLQLRWDKILTKKYFQTSTSEGKTSPLFELHIRKSGEIVGSFLQLRWDKILTKKYFQTSTSEGKTSHLFELHIRKSGEIVA